MTQAFCLTHVPFEGPGVFEWAINDLGLEFTNFLVPERGLPSVPGDFLIVMGGPMSANDSDPWIAEEIAFIRRAVEQRTRVIGVCLGAQLLAKAMGGSVYKGEKSEIGMTTIRLTESGQKDPLFSQLGNPAEVFQWHSEGIEPPPGAIVMAESDKYPVQAYRMGGRAVGLLFHVEMERTDVDHLCANCPKDVRDAGLTSSSILQASKFYLSILQQWGRTLVEGLAAS